jgi:hypothetical protein
MQKFPMPYADGRSHMNLLLVEDIEYVDPIIHMGTMYVKAVVAITLKNGGPIKDSMRDTQRRM